MCVVCPTPQRRPLLRGASLQVPDLEELGELLLDERWTTPLMAPRLMVMHGERVMITFETDSDN